MFDEYIQGRTLRRLARFSCSIGFLIEGYQAGVLGGVQETKPFQNAIENPTGTETIPMIASSYTLAAAFMSCVVMLIGLPLGRRNCIIIGNVFIVIGGIIQAASFSVPQIIVARVLCGFGIAFITCNVPMYMSEMSTDAKGRGPEVAINCSSLLFGVALSYWVTFGFTRMTNQVSWRMPVAIQSIFGILSGTSMVFLPDTPRWYYARDCIPEGDKTLSRIYGVYRQGVSNSGDIPEIQAMKEKIMSNFHVEEESSNRLTLLSLVWDNTPLRVGRRIAPLRYRHIGSAAGLLGVWLFTFLTVFAGGIAFETVGARIWIWPLIFNAIAFLFVYFMCPDPTNKTLEEVDALFTSDEAMLNRLNHKMAQKVVAQEIEDAS
ncbi:hypothetical protein N7462_001101 [Penicillium macrosclerotiorum]|uniref:uncharacterized protein n=1 Tax=Penicillium macrosclerotiorum TaxID=303699 RepID=UPI0025467CA8|nr:uncharacterized protein N7462_001101 [Penicillium macrosclerotiorum]KAJ5699096.1 hypothetical protein N7462_001101 [Penicillium macrosclerotiorum]